MKRFGKPFRLYTIYKTDSSSRIGRFRKKKKAISRAKQLREEGIEVNMITSKYWYVDIRSPGYKNTVRCTEVETIEEAKAVIDN